MSKEGFLSRQARHILENQRLALLAVIGLMLVPYMAWLGMAALALVTLRNDVKQGVMLIIPAFTAYVVVLLFTVNVNLALFDGLIRILPCFFAAFVLRATSSWKAVAIAFFCFLFFSMLCLQALAPQLIEGQFTYFQALLSDVDTAFSVQQVMEQRGLTAYILSNYLVGFQALFLCVSILSSLFLARSIQSNLYYPGGFRHEMLNFRGDVFSLFALLVVGLAAYKHQALAMNCIPLLLLYFTLAGVSLSASILSKYKPIKVMILLSLPCILLPRVALPFFVVLGSVDCLFNFRLYLSSRIGRIT